MARRNNQLNGREVDIVSKPVFPVTLTLDEALERFIADAERRGLRDFTVNYTVERSINYENFSLNGSIPF